MNIFGKHLRENSHRKWDLPVDKASAMLVFLCFFGHNVNSMILSETMEHLVVGGNFSAFSRYHRLFARDGGGEIGLLVPCLLERNEFQPCRIKGETALVYRDMAFHTLSESMIKSPWERYFLAPAKDGERERSCFWEDELFMEELCHGQMEGRPSKIVGEPSSGYVVNCDNGLSVTCRHIHWMADPREFARCYSGEVSLQPMDDVPGSLYVHYCFEGGLTDMTETLFFPLSYTHAQGHFIGKFQILEKGHQEVEFVTFLDMDETPEEEISKKIRILDRRLAKAFVNFKKIPHKKSIRVSSYLPLLGGDVPSLEGIHFL